MKWNHIIDLNPAQLDTGMYKENFSDVYKKHKPINFSSLCYKLIYTYIYIYCIFSEYTLSAYTWAAIPVFIYVTDLLCWANQHWLHASTSYNPTWENMYFPFNVQV